VRKGGLEPPRPCGHKILNLLRAPVAQMDRARTHLHLKDAKRMQIRQYPRDAGAKLLILMVRPTGFEPATFRSGV
jgi:hypothetical protein